MKTLAAHGLAGGIVQDRMGGSFSAGFLAAVASSYFGPSAPSNGNYMALIGNTARSAAVGGTVSVIGGGKFANGTETAAFGYLFSEAMQTGEGLKIQFASDNDFYSDLDPEAAYIAEGGNPIQVRKEFAIYKNTPMGKKVTSIDAIIAFYPEIGNGPEARIGGYSMSYNGGKRSAIAHEMGHTKPGGSYLDYPEQGDCLTCRVGNVEIHENPFRAATGQKPRNWYRTNDGRKFYTGQ